MLKFTKLKTAILILISAFSVLFSNIATAMSVSPIVIDLSVAGRNARNQITVINTLTYDLPVEINISEVYVDENGVTSTQDVGEDNFMIFPPQALIKPGATQVFRVQWVGEPDINESKSYIFSVAQLPVELDKGVSGIQLLYNFQVVVNVAPLQGKPALELLETGIEIDKDGVAHPVLVLENDSNVHAYLSATRLRIEMKNEQGKSVWRKSYDPGELGQSVGLGLVQPGKKRRMVLPFKLPENKGKITANIRYMGRK